MLTAPDGLVYFNALKADGNSLVIITGHAAAGTVGAGLFDEEYRRKNDVSVRAEKIICKVHLDEQDALSLQERLGFKKVILFHAIKEKNKSLLGELQGKKHRSSREQFASDDHAVRKFNE